MGWLYVYMQVRNCGGFLIWQLQRQTAKTAKFSGHYAIVVFLPE